MAPKRRDNYQTIFFDFWNTLVYGPDSYGEVWHTTASEAGFEVPRAALVGAMKETDRLYTPRLYEFKGRMKEFWDLYNTHLLTALGIRDISGDLLKAVNYVFLDVNRWVRLFPETRFVLSFLRRKGYGLGIVSNNTDELLDRMKTLDLSQYFDTITYSQEAGSEKPDPATFMLALNRAGKGPSECLHVGDSFEQDVLGAKSVGIEPVLVDREGYNQNADVTSIRSLDELMSTHLV